jgi:hypothetical protein
MQPDLFVSYLASESLHVLFSNHTPIIDAEGGIN